MTNKTRARLNKTLFRLRRAGELLGGVSLADGGALFTACHPVHRALAAQIAALEKCLNHPRQPLTRQMTALETQIVAACAAAGIPPPHGLAPGCRCETCQDAALAPLSPADRFRAGSVLIVCPVCGGKRCPHATHHANECSNSNLPGQPGSSYA